MEESTTNKSLNGLRDISKQWTQFVIKQGKVLTKDSNGRLHSTSEGLSRRANARDGQSPMTGDRRQQTRDDIAMTSTTSPTIGDHGRLVAMADRRSPKYHRCYHAIWFNHNLPIFWIDAVVYINIITISEDSISKSRDNSSANFRGRLFCEVDCSGILCLNISCIYQLGLMCWGRHWSCPQAV